MILSNSVSNFMLSFYLERINYNRIHNLSTNHGHAAVCRKDHADNERLAVIARELS